MSQNKLNNKKDTLLKEIAMLKVWFAIAMVFGCVGAFQAAWLLLYGKPVETLAQLGQALYPAIQNPVTLLTLAAPLVIGAIWFASIRGLRKWYRAL